MNKKTLLYLMFPVLCLSFLVGWKFVLRNQAKTFTFPIEGYDPRDLLSGHYLRFQVVYPEAESCKNFYETKILCLEPEVKLMTEESSDCTQFIKGRCSGDRFRPSSELNRFYIPEKHAAKLESLVRDPKHKPSVELYVIPDGSLQIKELLIDDKPWQSWL